MTNQIELRALLLVGDAKNVLRNLIKSALSEHDYVIANGFEDKNGQRHAYTDGQVFARSGIEVITLRELLTQLEKA